MGFAKVSVFDLILRSFVDNSICYSGGEFEYVCYCFYYHYGLLKAFSFCSDPFHEVKRRRDRKKEVSSQLFFFGPFHCI